jgi:cholest-4-en-3-one 26-monooxygenase
LTVKIDLFDSASFAEGVPHDRFTYLRENDPVYFHDEPDGPGFWCLTKYADIVQASKDWRTYSSAKGTNITDATGGAELMMVNSDPPYHEKLRKIVSKGFQPKMVADLEPHIREIVNSILDRVAPKGECDFVTEVSSELPLAVIAELMGVPEEDRHKIFEWSNTMIAQGSDPEYGSSMDDATRAFLEMSQLVNAIADKRSETPEQDLITKLVEGEVDGERLTVLEYDVFMVLLAVAGNETTRNLISGGLLALIEHPQERAKLMADPALTPLAVEEMLRWVTPVMHFRRTATTDCEIRGKQIRSGDKVLLWYISGNRDTDVFADPFRFDVARDPNPHMTFGAGGPHFCLGFSLAQLEIKVMFEELFKRLPDIELNGDVEHLHSNFINGIRHMPVRFTPERV